VVPLQPHSQAIDENPFCDCASDPTFLAPLILHSVMDCRLHGPESLATLEDAISSVEDYSERDFCRRERVSRPVHPAHSSVLGADDLPSMLSRV
jgi:hypothetical protein